LVRGGAKPIHVVVSERSESINSLKHLKQYLANNKCSINAQWLFEYLTCSEYCYSFYYYEVLYRYKTLECRLIIFPTLVCLKKLGKASSKMHAFNY
jgi:hypothetical protein